MASTITNGKLVVKISESFLLNNKEQGGVTTTILSDVNEYSKRIVTLVADTSHTIAEFANTITSVLEYDSSKLKYIRITNLDDTTKVIVTYGAGTTAAALPVQASGSLLLFGKGARGAASDAAITSTSSLDSIYLRSSAAIDVEILIATT